MGAWVGRMRGAIAAVALVLVMLMQPAQAQQSPGVEPWQAVITSQIEAFRLRDASGAFQYAAAGFHTTFPSAEAFFVAIVASGYAPIVESRSHAFGTFQVLADKSVLQQVKLVGNDQTLYEAFYQLAEEPEGWRVRAVQLIKQPGMGI